MAKRNMYQEKTKPILTFLYIVVALALVAALFVMFQKDRSRRKEYGNLVLDAAADEASLDIASKKNVEELVLDDAGELTPTATPEPTATPAPTDTPEPTPTIEPVETMPVADENVVALPTTTPYIPEDDLVDEELAQGIEED